MMSFFTKQSTSLMPDWSRSRCVEQVRSGRDVGLRSELRQPARNILGRSSWISSSQFFQAERSDDGVGLHNKYQGMRWGANPESVPAMGITPAIKVGGTSIHMNMLDYTKEKFFEQHVTLHQPTTADQPLQGKTDLFGER
jgi:hypothetical protein